MPLTNTSSRYGAVSKAFHWLTVALILTLIPLGIYANGLPFDTGEALARKGWFFSLHKTLGVILFLLALARIVWTLIQPRPGLLNADKRGEALIAETVHWLLYASLVVVPLSGWVTHAASEGFAPIWGPFGQSLPLVPKSEALSHTAASLHIIFERVLVVALILHVAGALKHHVIDRDATLRRMLPGTGPLPTPPAQHRALAPVAGAATAYAVALAIGAGLGLFSSHGAALPEVELAETKSGWTVESGTLGITVTQFGKEVTGSFADWTAAIEFTPDIHAEENGRAEVTIAIPSLTLGSVTQQALGADFFDAETHPTAVFAARILPIIDGYQADGTLTLKGAAVPVTFPFHLALDGDTAQMSGNVALDRLDFGIGQNMADESTLGFAVRVDIELVAHRTPD